MNIDLDAFPPDVKLALIDVGESFGSDETFAQATQTLQGLEKYADTLRPYGLPLSDGKLLEEARDLLSEARYGRNEAKGKKKSLSVGLDDANRAGRTARTRGRSVLTSTLSALSRRGKTEAATHVQTTLETTTDSTQEGEALAKQLEQLADALDPQKAPEAAAAAADRGGPETLSPLRDAAAALREVVKKKPTVRGTPVETQRLDQIDGIIVDICRRGRDAAEAASKDLGDPAILKAFKLDKLYPWRSASKKTEEGKSGEAVEQGAGAPSTNARRRGCTAKIDRPQPGYLTRCSSPRWPRRRPSSSTSRTSRRRSRGRCRSSCSSR